MRFFSGKAKTKQGARDALRCSFSPSHYTYPEHGDNPIAPKEREEEEKKEGGQANIQDRASLNNQRASLNYSEEQMTI